MSPNSSAVLDAWDDDWETLADQNDASVASDLDFNVKLSRAERKAKHEEANKQLWDAAETADKQPLFLQTRDNVPLQSDWRPAIKVLARKPPSKAVSRPNVVSAMADVNLEDGDDSEEEERKKAQQEYVERQARAQREREEKLRKYQEARERLFGSPTPAEEHVRASTANETTSGSKNSSRGKGRGRVERDGAADSPLRRSNPKKQLYDPNFSGKPNSIHLQKRGAQGTPEVLATEERPVRAPRGPDGSGRGGFGFAPRGARTGTES